MKKILFLLLAFNYAFGEEIYASFNVEASKQSKLALESIGLVQKFRRNWTKSQQRRTFTCS